MAVKEDKNIEKKQENHWKFEKEAIEYLAEIISNTSICNIEYDCSNFSIKLSKNGAKYVAMAENEAPVVAPKTTSSETIKASPKEVVVDKPKEVVQEEIGTYVTSPMVGRFYGRPNPNDKAYMEVGMQVKVGQTLCIVEAMKVMNHVKSTKDGVIKEILLKDGAPVEYGQKLILIE